MKNTLLLSFLILSLIFSEAVVAQHNPEPRFPQQPNYNAGFDVIIKKNGDIVYGLVQEVGLELIKYKRTDIPDGPVYTMFKDEVYAISYRNQVKEIFAPVMPIDSMPPLPVMEPYYKRGNNFFRKGNANFGVGFLRSFTSVDNANDYSSSGGFPVLSFGYEVPYRPQVKLGAMLAFGSHTFKRQEYSVYDSTTSNVKLKENLFTLYAYGKYSFMDMTAKIRPYIIGGLGITSSSIHSTYEVSFFNNPDKVLEVTSGSRSIGLGLLARVGGSYYFNPRTAVFADAGIGPSVLNLGISVNVN